MDCATCEIDNCGNCLEPERDDPYDGDEWGDTDAECEAFGGIGCKYCGCDEWGGDGLCLVEMRAGYGWL